MGPRSALCLPLFGLGLIACSSTAQIEHELSRLRQEMRTLRVQLQDETKARESLENRVTLLTTDRRRPSELARSGPEPSARGGAGRSVSAQMEPALPDLPVVKLPPDMGGEAGLGAPDDGGAPVMIRLGPGDGDGRLSVDHSVLDKPDPVLGSASIRAEPKSKPNSKVSMNEHYALALSKLRQENDPSRARGLLLEFVEKYPGSQLLPNAVFWLGECSYVEKNYSRAVREFQGLLTEHPRSAKVPDAMLRLAVSFKKLGKQREADEVARRLLSEHPESEAAKQVPDQVGSLRG